MALPDRLVVRTRILLMPRRRGQSGVVSLPSSGSRRFRADGYASMPRLHIRLRGEVLARALPDYCRPRMNNAARRMLARIASAWMGPFPAGPHSIGKEVRRAVETLEQMGVETWMKVAHRLLLYGQQGRERACALQFACHAAGQTNRNTQCAISGSSGTLPELDIT